jgi:gamma-glutamylaminecyclotransferase
MHRVFVYGTLKRGFPNAEGLHGVACLGRYRTRDAFPLIVGGQWFSPALLPERGVGHRVTGELYAVDDAKLAELDLLESIHLPTGYTRELNEIENLDDGSTLEAWVYFKARNRISIIHSGYLDDYTDTRYVPLAQRSAGEVR